MMMIISCNTLKILRTQRCITVTNKIIACSENVDIKSHNEKLMVASVTSDIQNIFMVIHCTYNTMGPYIPKIIICSMLGVIL